MPKTEKFREQYQTTRSVHGNKLNEPGTIEEKLRTLLTDMGNDAEKAAEAANRASLVALHDALVANGTDAHTALAAMSRNNRTRNPKGG